jgi:hypothetical protein
LFRDRHFGQNDARILLQRDKVSATPSRAKQLAARPIEEVGWHAELGAHGGAVFEQLVEAIGSRCIGGVEQRVRKQREPFVEYGEAGAERRVRNCPQGDRVGDETHIGELRLAAAVSKRVIVAIERVELSCKDG